MSKQFAIVWCILCMCVCVCVSNRMPVFGSNTSLEDMIRHKAYKQIVLNKILSRLNLTITKSSVGHRLRDDREHKRSLPKPQDKTYTELSRMVIMAEKNGKYSSPEILDFKLNGALISETISLKSIDMHLSVFVKPKCRQTFSKKWYRRNSIAVVVSSVANNDTITVVRKSGLNKTETIKVPLPLQSIKDALITNEGEFALRVQCFGCSRRIQLALVSNSARRPRKRCRRTLKSLRLRQPKTKGRRRRKKNCVVCVERRYRPVLVVKADKLHNQRFRRNAASCSQRTSCCKSNVRIVFSEIEWDHWVIYPPEFTTAHCKGYCANSVSTASNNVNATCQPTDFRPFRIVYIDQAGSVRENTLYNIVARGCACQVRTESSEP